MFSSCSAAFQLLLPFSMPRDHLHCANSRQLVGYSADDIRSQDWTKSSSVSGCDSNEEERRPPVADVNESTEDVIGDEANNVGDRHYFTAATAEIGDEGGEADGSRRLVRDDPTRVGLLPVVERNCGNWLDYPLPAAPDFLSLLSKSITSSSEHLLARGRLHAPCTSLQRHFHRFSGDLEGHPLPPHHQAFPPPSSHPQFWNLERQGRNLELLSSRLPRTQIQNGNCTENLPSAVVVNSTRFYSDRVSSCNAVFNSSAESSRYSLNTKPNRIWRPYDDDDDIEAERNENYSKRLLPLET